MPEPKMPPLEEFKEESREGFDHEAHMAKVEEGLNRIIASDDINEIKQIAQSLLTEEKTEQKVEEGMGGTLNDYLGGGK